MRHLLKRIIELENRTEIENCRMLIYLINDGHHFISEGYFTDTSDQKQYLDWRVENIKKEMRHNSTPYQTYALTKEDIQKHLDAFRKEQEAMIKLAKDYEENYRRELCMPLPSLPVLARKTSRLIEDN